MQTPLFCLVTILAVWKLVLWGNVVSLLSEVSWIVRVGSICLHSTTSPSSLSYSLFFFRETALTNNQHIRGLIYYKSKGEVRERLRCTVNEMKLKYPRRIPLTVVDPVKLQSMGFGHGWTEICLELEGRKSEAERSSEVRELEGKKEHGWFSST